MDERERRDLERALQVRWRTDGGAAGVLGVLHQWGIRALGASLHGSDCIWYSGVNPTGY